MKREELIDLSDIKKPQADNKKGAFGSFYFRDVYDSFLFTDAERDLWYEDNFLGRVNENNEPVVLLERFLQQLPSKEKTLLALPPVVSAWKALMSHIEKGIFRGDVDPEGSLYAKVKPVYAWTSPHKWYSSYNASMYGTFTGNFMHTFRDQRIQNFDGFLKVFVDYAQQFSERFPFTREGFLLSKFATPHFGGMCIEIAEVDHDRDIKKAEYLSDRNFEFFKKAAHRHGFKLDRNAPWRLIPDLSSRGMKRHMKAVGTSEDDFYKDYFVKGYEWELENFKHYLWGWYNNYVNANPIVKVMDTSGKKTEMMLMERASYTEDELYSEYSDHFFIKLYVYVRAIETGKLWSQSTYDRIVYKARELMRLKDKNTAMRYIHTQIDPCSTPRSKQLFNKKCLTQAEKDAIVRNKTKKKKNFSYY